MNSEAIHDRTNEWFVPSFGPPRLRVLVGLLYLPYTAMVLSYTVIGSMMAQRIDWHRVAAIVIIYFLALGIGGHALDAVGSKAVKPWGPIVQPRILWGLAVSSLTIAYAIGLYYILTDTPLLWLIAVPEGFFLLAYNLEWFEGYFHTDGWFAVSWGGLPVLAGYIIQTNRVSLAVIVVAASMSLLSLVEITASRPYKTLKRAPEERGAEQETRQHYAGQFELILKSVSMGVMLLGLGMLAWRLNDLFS